MKIFSILPISLTFLMAASQPATMQNTEQLLVVTTKNWNTPAATLQRFEKKGKEWKKTGKTLKVITGKSGLGWGIGLHKVSGKAKYIKREGDGRAPAGIFRLKNGFGYHPFAISYPYTVYKETDYCVDDGKSKWYNKIIDSTKVPRDYNSFEKMKFRKNYYRYGLVVDHNSKAVPGAGSCIFMHIKKPNHIPTVGCTAMSESEMKSILRWLDPKRHPLLIQAPESEMKRLLPF
ncbi:MAG: L,D-transpeptidase family protein [Campylobacterota bacterium]|nr:L,D-transpeptidase family protein [Campylobacterota bacterium]